MICIFSFGCILEKKTLVKGERIVQIREKVQRHDKGNIP